MCLNFVEYYPAIPMNSCVQIPGTDLDFCPTMTNLKGNTTEEIIIDNGVIIHEFQNDDSCPIQAKGGTMIIYTIIGLVLIGIISFGHLVFKHYRFQTKNLQERKEGEVQQTLTNLQQI
jgi:hypothetical protein